MSQFNTQHNRAVWFDIPVSDLDRANAFYANVLAIHVEKQSFGDVTFSVLEHDQGNGGCLVVKPGEVSSDRGILVYLNVNGRIRDAVSKVDLHGGKVVQDIQSMGPHGFCAVVLDSEGNRLALHSEIDS